MKILGVMLGDTHCGHLVGMTHRKYQLEEVPDESEEHKELRLMQRGCYDWAKGTMAKLGKLDVALLMGDLIDGPGRKSGGVEQISTNCLTQCKMFEAFWDDCVKRYSPDIKAVGVRGTGYHTGDAEDYEDVIAEKIGADFKDEQFITIGGVKFNLKHHVGSSAVPQARYGALGREQAWAALKAQFGHIEAMPQVLVRAHAHYHVVVSDPESTAMILPALQSPATRYGRRRCSGIVHFGLVYFEINNGVFSWKSVIARIPALQVTYTKVM